MFSLSVGKKPAATKEDQMNDKQITLGSVVYVDRNANHSDGFYGIFTVVGLAGDDLKLARGEYEITPDQGEYDVFITRRRCTLVD